MTHTWMHQALREAQAFVYRAHVGAKPHEQDKEDAAQWLARYGKKVVRPLDVLKLQDVPRVGPQTYRILREAGVDTVEDLAAMDPGALLRLPRFGRKSLRLVQTKLEELDAPIFSY